MITFDSTVTVGALLFLLGMLLFAPGVLAILARRGPVPPVRTRAVSSNRKSGRTR